MKIDFSQKLISFDGTLFTQEDGTPLDLKKVALTACSTTLQTDGALDPMARYRIGEAGATLFRGLDLADDQLEVIKERVRVVIVSPALVFAAVNALDGIPEPAAVLQAPETTDDAPAAADATPQADAVTAEVQPAPVEAVSAEVQAAPAAAAPADAPAATV
jgi:hypothetical protein